MQCAIHYQSIIAQRINGVDYQPCDDIDFSKSPVDARGLARLVEQRKLLPVAVSINDHKPSKPPK